jgi:eukaryotic-like serine/threonine-protein kinase
MDCPVCFTTNPVTVLTCISCGASLTDESSGSSPLHLPPKTLLKQGKYRIEDSIGEGGFGITYRGIDLSCSKEFAIKEFLPERSSRKGTKFIWSPSINPQQRREQLHKFNSEAKSLSKCNHPNIVKVFDCFEENETSYIVMELVKGETLSSKLKREKIITESQVKIYFAQLANALKAIHDEGLLHRDIKPDNIIINQHNEPILIDFGNSREFVEGRTQKMTNIGTREYAPLEQNSSTGKFAPRIDIYSLSATIFELLTGKLPSLATERAIAIAGSKPDPLILPSKISKVSQSMERIVLTGLKIKAEDRFQSAEELIDALNGKFISSKLKKARDLVDQSELSSAVQAYNACLNSEPQNGEAAIELAQVQIYLNDSQAELAAQKAIQLMSNDSRGFGILGLVHCRKSNWHDAVKHLQQAASLTPQMGWILANLAWAQGMVGNWQKAQEAITKAAKLDHEDPFILALQSWIAGNQKNWKPAISFGRQAIYKAKQAKYPYLQKLQEWVYPCLTIALENALISKQADDVKRCIQEFSTNVPSSADVWGFKGWEKVKQGLISEASAHFDEAASKSEIPIWVLCNRAIAYEILQNPLNALSAYNDTHQLYPKDAFIQFRIGSLLGQKGDWLLAKTHLEKAIQLRNDYAEAYHNLAWILLNIQKQDSQSKFYRDIHATYSKAVELYKQQQKNKLAELIKQSFQEIGIVI